MTSTKTTDEHEPIWPKSCSTEPGLRQMDLILGQIGQHSPTRSSFFPFQETKYTKAPLVSPMCGEAFSATALSG